MMSYLRLSIIAKNDMQGLRASPPPHDWPKVTYLRISTQAVQNETKLSLQTKSFLFGTNPPTWVKLPHKAPRGHSPHLKYRTAPCPTGPAWRRSSSSRAAWLPAACLMKSGSGGSAQRSRSSLKSDRWKHLLGISSVLAKTKPLLHI